MTTSLQAETPFLPMDRSVPDLLAEGWEVAGSLGNGALLMQNGDQISFCIIDIKGGHFDYLGGETDLAERFSTIDANCAALIE
ncbi:hypothetical protein [Parasulfitobacter algicola]|uniref:Uncharacterized protein n=1 Tax=Parasulfitobacter algicola TaxID=2614809 RepID=A0ABX2IZW8_9RHOB|nr:hypothetical protein [Sulfitobacter algicola]NSX56872.1 hypothetical protein [Sulfitobacter algicola]